MKNSRFQVFVEEADTEETKIKVVDVLTGEIIGTFSHHWRADEFIKAKEKEATTKGEPIWVLEMHNTKGEIFRRVPVWD